MGAVCARLRSPINTPRRHAPNTIKGKHATSTHVNKAIVFCILATVADNVNAVAAVAVPQLARAMMAINIRTSARIKTTIMRVLAWLGARCVCGVGASGLCVAPSVCNHYRNSVAVHCPIRTNGYTLGICADGQ